MDYITISGRVRSSSSAENLADSQQDVGAYNNRRDLLIAQSMPQASELSRLGQSFYVTQPTSTASLNGVVPTTTSTFSMNNTDTVKSYLIDTVSFFLITAAGGSSGVTIFAQVNKGAQTALSTLDTITIGTTNGRATTAGSLATFKSGATVTNDGWVAIASMSSSGTLAKSAGAVIEVKGMFIVPPSGIFSIGVAGDGTSAGKCGIIWHEVTIPTVK